MATDTFEQSTYKHYSYSAWADRPAANSSVAGTRITISDIGAGRASDWITNGTRWSPLGGTLMLASLGAPVAAIANVETIVLQTRIPAGAWQVNDSLRF